MKGVSHQAHLCRAELPEDRGDEQSILGGDSRARLEGDARRLDAVGNQPVTHHRRLGGADPITAGDNHLGPRIILDDLERPAQPTVESP